MSDAACPSESVRPSPPDPLRQVRAVAGVRVAVRHDGAATGLDVLHETGGYRLKFPERSGDTLEAVIVNTGGGVAGGDRVSIVAQAGAGARISLTTATAERFYRSSAAPSVVEVHLEAGEGALVACLPQASVLFSGCNVQRSIVADLAADATLIVAETVVFGRAASGEQMTQGRFRDQWRVHRAGRLVFADATCVEGDIRGQLSRPAVSAGAAIATLLVCVAPDAESRRDPVRSALAARPMTAGVSAWNGMLVARMLCDRLDVAASGLRGAVAALNLCPLPKAWTH